MPNTRTREFRAAPGKRPFAVLLATVVVVFALPVLYLVIAWLGAPKQIRYELDSASLSIVTAGGFTGDTKRILLSRIDSVDETYLSGGTLRFGAPKGGYCVGFWRYPAIGEVWQATDCSENAVVIRASGETNAIVITPSDRSAFLSALKNPRQATFTTPTKPSGVSLSIFLTFAAICWPAAAVLGALFVVAPARLRYRVAGGELVVSTIMLSHRTALAGAKARRHQPLQGEKLSGVRVPGYCGGTFVLDEAPTSVVATGLDHGVLVEGDERLFVTPQDEQGFLAALAEAGVAVR